MGFLVMRRGLCLGRLGLGFKLGERSGEGGLL